MTAPPAADGTSCPGAGGSSERVRVGRLLRRRDGLIGVAILVVFVVLALVPDLLVGPLETAVTATGGRLEPPSAAHLAGHRRAWVATCST